MHELRKDSSRERHADLSVAAARHAMLTGLAANGERQACRQRRTVEDASFPLIIIIRSVEEHFSLCRDVFLHSQRQRTTTTATATAEEEKKKKKPRLSYSNGMNSDPCAEISLVRT